MRNLATLACAAVLASAQNVPSRPRIREASGCVVHGNHLYVVDDSDTGAYYRVPWKKNIGPVVDLNRQKPERVRLESRNLGVDLESIDILGDGRVAVLSERLRSLVSDDGIIAEYDSELAEVGKRGLEGLAARPLADGSTQVAVLWEGGYPDFGFVAPNRTQAVFKPLIVIHDVPKMRSVGRVRLREALRTIELDVPNPDPGTAEPLGQRFRAPDLRWCRYQKDGKTETGFLVLLSSQNGVAQPEFRHKWLQRFDMNGKPVGEPLDLAGVIPKELWRGNFEGLSWLETGKSVVMVHEEDPGLDAHAIVFSLPRDWQF